MNPDTYYVYVLRFRGWGFTAHYTGIAIDPDKRCRQHANGTGAKCLRGVTVEDIIWQSPRPLTRGKAQQVEAKIKRLQPHLKSNVLTLERVFAAVANLAS